MKLAVYSDLHLETLRRHPHLAQIPTPHQPVDRIVLAGDIHSGTDGLDALAQRGRGHIYVAGNHEYYHHDIEILDDRLREKAAALGVHYLQRDTLILGNTRFLGTTLWTDFNIQRTWKMGAELVAKSFLPDYKLIRYRGRILTPRVSQALHEQNVDWLRQKLAEPFEGQTVVITHHAPHPQSIHPRFNLSPINAAFVSDLTPLVTQADVWIHGHMHDSFDYTVQDGQGRCRVKVNPRGYLRKAPKHGRAVFENAFFDAQCVLDLAQEDVVHV